MKISTTWLQDYVNIDIESKSYLYDIIVGEVIEVKPHPNADKLNVAQVELGGTVNTIVCGAPNLAEGQKVPVALPGTKLPGDFTITKRNIREVESNGMICSEDELGLKEERQEGIMILPEKWEAGTSMSEVLGLKGLTAGQLGEMITLHTAEVEEVIPVGDDYVIDIDNKSLTHRPDLWGHQGIAREVAAITNEDFTAYTPQVAFPESGETIECNIQNAEICNRFCTVVINNVKIKESPDWLKERLEAVGINPINNVVDITNYVMFDLGHPMHAFDRQKLDSNTINIRFSSTDESFVALNENNYKLDPLVPVLASDQQIHSIAGIIGGNDTAINAKTTSIVFEAANWDAPTVRKASTLLGLRTDASQRFEKALDPEIAPVAIHRAVEILQAICPDCEIAGPLYDHYPNPAGDHRIVLNLEKINSYIGQEIELNQVKTILSSLGFIIEKETKTVLTIIVPSWRATKDVRIEADLLEEIIRMYGYEQIEPRLPELPTTPPTINRQRELEHNLRYNLQGLGVTEVYNYSFYGQTEINKALLNVDDHITLRNYLSENQTHMRTSMVPNLLNTIHENLKHRDEFSIFELGRTYTETTEFFPAEEKQLIVATVTDKKGQPFFTLKGIIEQLMNQYLAEYSIDVSDHSPSTAHPYQIAQVTHQEHVLGYIYTLHPLVQKEFDLGNAAIAICELNTGYLTHKQSSTPEYQPLPKYPDLEFDISVIVYEAITVNKLVTEIKKAAPELIHTIELFDLYRGDNVPEGKKSAAFHINLRHAERTLTDAEMLEVQQKIFANLEEIGGKIRGL